MAAKIHELRRQREDQKEKANAALRVMQAQAKSEGRGLTDAEKAEDDKARAALAVIDGEMEIEERILASERQYGSALPHTGPGAPVPGAGPLPDPKPATDPKAADVFPSIGHRLKAIREAAKGAQFTDRRLLAASGLNEAVDSDGGFLVGIEDGGTLLEQTYETGILSRRVRRAPIGAGFNGLKYNLLDETSRANGSRYGGIQAYWGAEAGTLTASKPSFRQLELRLKKLHGLMYMTDELVEDAVALEGFVNEWVPQEFGFKLDDAIFAGTGGGIPLGITVCPAKVQVAKETSPAQGVDTVVAANIYNMYARMPAASLANAEWFINVAVWPQLFVMQQTVGTGGLPLFLPAGGISAAPFGTLLGRPIIPIEQAAALGDAGDIVFADMSRYLLADKGSIKAAVSMHVKFLTDEMAYRWTLRIDGQPIPNAPMTPYKGANTLSPFITLEAR